ncbi:MAG: M23 family metallopeptidase, partial [candidate division WOR-3 bacterium]
SQRSTLDGKNVNQLSNILDELLLRAENQYSTNKNISLYLEEKQNLKNSIPSIAPVNGWFMRGFGYCLDPFTGAIKMHEGIDIAAPVGTPIIVPADGVVRKILNTTDFGIVIEINHNQNFTTVYAHCQNPRVSLGQSVKRGDIIGDVGTSGKITGPHLHYEIRISGMPIDPLNYIILDKSARN